MRKKSHILWPVLIATSGMAVTGNKLVAPQEDSFLDHLTLSARFGFNVHASFGPRITPNGGAYNFIDGYVLTDSTADFDPTGTFPGITQYWGYDNSARQADVANDRVLFTQVAAGGSPGHSFDEDPRAGLELSYMRELGKHGKWNYGFEVAVNYMNLCLRDSNGSSGNAVQYAFPYFPGTSPPSAATTGGQPYQGAFDPAQQAGFVISDTGTVIGNVPFSTAGTRQFDADILGFRVGPYLQRALGEKHKADLNIIGGLAVALINAKASWSEATTVNGVTDPTYSGSGKGCDVLWGYYIGANISWHLNKRWDVNGGVQFQDVGKYSQNLGSRAVKLDMSESVFVTVGVSYKF